MHTRLGPGWAHFALTIFGGWTLLSAPACGGAQSTEEAAAAAAKNDLGVVTADQLGPPPKRERQRFIVVHRNTAAHLAPDASSPRIQFRTWEEQEELERAEAEAEAERLRKAQEREEARKKALAERKKKQKKKPKKKKKPKPLTPKQLEAKKKAEEEKKRKGAVRTLRKARKKARSKPFHRPEAEHVVLRVTGSKGEWFEVVTLDAKEQQEHCHRGGWEGLEHMKVRLYVRASEALQVTTEQVTVQFPRGTEVSLQPGVPVSGSGDDTVVHVDGYELSIPVPEDALGDGYRFHHVYDEVQTDQVFSPVAWVDDKLAFTKKKTLPYNPYRKMFVMGTAVNGSRFYAQTQTICAQFMVTIDPELVEDAARRGPTRITGDEDVIGGPHIPAGSAVYLEDGKEFGEVSLDMPIDGVHFQRTGSLMCTTQHVWRHPAPKKKKGKRKPAPKPRDSWLLQWCVDPDDIAGVASAQ